MKNIFLASLIALFSAAFVTTVSAKDNMNMSAKMKMMSHVTPMPGLMMVVRHHKDELSLNEEQVAKMDQWSSVQGPRVAVLAKEIINTEKQILEATLNGESADDIQKLANSMMAKRREIITTKLMCRDNMKNNLSQQQWNKVVELYSKEFL